MATPQERTLAVIRGAAMNEKRGLLDARIAASGLQLLSERPVDDENQVIGFRAPCVLLALEGPNAITALRELGKAWTGEMNGDTDIAGSTDTATAQQMIQLTFPDIEWPLDAAQALAKDLAGGGKSKASKSPALSARKSATSTVDMATPASFKARPMPPSHTRTPSQTPRMSKAALLRLGLSPAAVGPISPASSESTSIFSSAPQERRCRSTLIETTHSPAAPATVPRANRASALRASQRQVGTRPDAAPIASIAVDTPTERPGASTASTARRRQSVQLDSSSSANARPTVAPRPTRASTLRIGGQGRGTPTLSPSSKARVALSTAERAAAARGHRLSLHAVTTGVQDSSMSLSSSVFESLDAHGARTALAPPSANANKDKARIDENTGPKVPSHTKALSLSTSTVKPASVTPRPNRAALLRAKVGGAQPKQP